MYRAYMKRFLDIVLSLAGVIVLAIPMLLIAAIVRLDSPGPVLFGKGGSGYIRSAL